MENIIQQIAEELIRKILISRSDNTLGIPTKNLTRPFDFK